MRTYKIEKVDNMDHIQPYLKIYFNGIINGDAIETYLRNIDSVKKCNMHTTDNLKYYAIVHPSPCWSIDEAIADIQDQLDRFLVK